MRLHNSSKQEVSRNFQVEAPTMLSRVGNSSPIGISLIRRVAGLQERSRASRAEDAYVVHVALHDVTATDLWLNGRHIPIQPMRKGGMVMANLESEPSVKCHSAIEFVRYYIARDTLDALGEEYFGKRSEGLRRPDFGTVDPIIYHLSAAAAPLVQRAAPGDQILIDQMALALYRRLVLMYGGVPIDKRVAGQGCLAPWQERRVKGFIEENLNAVLTLEDLAQVCRLSASHFTRAFKHTTGRTPHRWLLERRIEAAKTQLLRSERALAELSGALGFSDASHFSRVFVNVTGETPADWRRRRAPAMAQLSGSI
jgi:AraC family transcriptional regulator